MITFTKSYSTTDGQIFASIEAAQRHELEVALMQGGLTDSPNIATIIMDKKDVFVDILTMTPNSKPKARSIHGGKKTRTPKTIITDATTSVTSAANTPVTTPTV